ncbi:DUF4352 domain-containing protein [Pseudonocardia sp. K10HN5]|uniref:DUF4352 domain-containing protein n=2 Tax=Pseudonocardia acidicola TaxID=2724939 RepID=A0ABX1S3P9_9PSEU|nr:DUF4352 domain-containing protein [Pseudonocardia acidicola]NMH96146.1 DUF4352 domain-containing protein [Pseudonocardia acidicola]
MRGLVGAAIGLAAVLSGCSAAPAGSVPAPAPAGATYPLPPRPVRPGETPLHIAPATEGDTVFEVIGLTTGMATILGSHAEWPAKGQFVRIRLVVINNGRSSVLFDTNRQLLLTADGQTHVPDSQAMLIKRQPGQFDLGAADRLELDLYYDIPEDGTPTALRAFGGPSLQDLQDTTGVDIPLR